METCASRVVSIKNTRCYYKINPSYIITLILEEKFHTDIFYLK